jgi:hypothetical protein
MPALARVLNLSLWRAVRAPAPAPRELHLDAVRDALARAERLLEPTPATVIVLRPVLPPTPPPAKPKPKLVVVKEKKEEEDAASPWDPEPETVTRFVAANDGEDDEPLVRDDALVLQEINGCKTLLLEIIRRAAYDYVLYRGNRRMAYRILADQAHAWLFSERPGTKDWNQRQREGKFITSFEAICEALDLDPDTVRNHVKRLTPRNVMSVGRPAEYRRRDVFSGSQGDDDAYSVPGGLIDYSEPSDDETIY